MIPPSPQTIQAFIDQVVNNPIAVAFLINLISNILTGRLEKVGTFKKVDQLMGRLRGKPRPVKADDVGKAERQVVRSLTDDEVRDEIGKALGELRGQTAAVEEILGLLRKSVEMTTGSVPTGQQLKTIEDVMAGFLERIKADEGDRRLWMEQLRSVAESMSQAKPSLVIKLGEGVVRDNFDDRGQLRSRSFAEKEWHVTAYMNGRAASLWLEQFIHAQGPSEAAIQRVLLAGSSVAQLQSEGNFTETGSLSLVNLIKDITKMGVVKSEEKAVLAGLYALLGNDSFHKGDYAHSEASYRDAFHLAQDLEDNRLLREYHYLLGSAVGMAGRHAEALKHFDDAIGLGLEESNVFYNRGIALNEMGRREEAVASYDKAVDYGEKAKDLATVASAFYNRGVALNGLGRREEAVASYDKAVELRGNLVDKGERVFPAWTVLVCAIGVTRMKSGADEALKVIIQSFSKVYMDAKRDGMNKVIDLQLEELRPQFEKEHGGAFKQFMEILRYVMLQRGEVDPFDVPLLVLKYLDIDQVDELYEALHEKYGGWIKEKLSESNARFIVVCDHKVVFASDDPYGPPANKVKELADSLGKACYTVGGETPVEEMAGAIPWSDLGSHDYYPTVEVYLGDPSWSDSEVFAKGIQLITDFDTGNPNIHVFSQDVCQRITPPVEWWEYRTSYHLGRIYRFYPREVKVGVENQDKITRCIIIKTQCVRFWDDEARNPFKIVNPRRNGFVGRELMLRLTFQITLNPKTHTSTLHLLT